MKKLILNTLIVAFFLTGLCVIGVNTSLASRLSDYQIIAQVEDPNEPGPEMVLGSIQLAYLEEDPNEPEPEPAPEIVLYDLKLVYLDDDPNEPMPEPDPE